MKPVIGIVGGIGSGKSVLADMLARKNGGKVVSGDQLGHEALRQPEIKRQIQERFGAKILDGEGEIDRHLLGRIVFSQPSLRKHLEELVHPWIARRIREEIALAEADAGTAFVVLDAAVMMEAGWSDVCDHVIWVEAPRQARLHRVGAQRGWTEEEVASREHAQMPLDEKRKRCDLEIDNTGTLEEVEQQLTKIVKRLGLGNRSR